MLLIETILEAIAEGLTPSGDLSKRGQVVVRLLFGIVIAGLSVAGIWVTYGYDMGAHLRWAGMALFFFLGCFGLFNVALGRQWKWPGCLFVLSFVAMFAARILFGM